MLKATATQWTRNVKKRGCATFIIATTKQLLGILEFFFLLRNAVTTIDDSTIIAHDYCITLSAYAATFLSVFHTCREPTWILITFSLLRVLLLRFSLRAKTTCKNNKNFTIL